MSRERDNHADKFFQRERSPLLCHQRVTAIALLSICGLFWPRPFAAVLLVQLVYKASWLVVIALPAVLGSRSQQIPAGIGT